MAKKGQFKKGGGRHSGGAMVVVERVARKQTKRKRRVGIGTSASGRSFEVKPKKRRRAHASHGISLTKAVGTALVLGNVAGKNNGVLGPTVYDLVQKVPGAKTIGGTAAAGLIIGGVWKFTKIGGRLRPLMACAGLVGAVAAALKLAEVGSDIKWLGDAGDSSDHLMDVET